MKIIFNAREMELAEEEISYETIMRLMNEREDAVLSVTYGIKNGMHGILSMGKSVKLVEGMVISAFDTSNA